jgi:hypothetical protein
MPCYAVREVEQVLENIPDIQLLAGGLKEMGFNAQVSGTSIYFSGVDKTTGMYQSGSYANGKLTTQEGLDLEMLKKYTAVANIKKQVAENNKSKYKSTKLTLHKLSEFHYKVTKS